MKQKKIKKVKVTADVDPTVKKKAKVKAAQEDTNLSAKVEDLLTQYVKK
jgi:predicted HicB family RNase H-like nuclease